MVVVSYSGKEINAKLVYYGAGLCGKTTNLEAIYEAVPETSRGKMVSMKTQSDRTLFFDLLPLDLGEIMGFKTRFLLYTVPGQVFYNATRKLVLKGADALVFVADSSTGKMDENLESLQNLKQNLSEYGLRLEEIPWVLQYNKRDLPNVYSIDEMNASLNPGAKVPVFEAVACQGTGVFETFRGISHLLMQKVTRELHRSPQGAAAARAAKAAVDTPARAAEPVAAVQPQAPERAPMLDGQRFIDFAARTEPDSAGAQASGAGAVTGGEPPSGIEPSPVPAAAATHDGTPPAFERGGPSLAFEIDRGKSQAPGTDPAPFADPRPAARHGASAADDMFNEEPAGLARGAPPSATRSGGVVPKFEERTLSLAEAAGARAASQAIATDGGPNAPTGRHEVVVPITIPIGEAHEIVVRITIRPTR